MPIGRHRVYTGARVRADFRLERLEIRKLAQSTRMRNLVVGIARKRAMPYAKAISQDFRDDGDYLRGFRVVSRYITPPPDRWPMRRISARLLNQARHATIVEVGKKKKNAHWILRRTLLNLERTNGDPL